MNIKFDLFPQGKTKALTMSYDDGQIFDRRLVGIFNKYGIRGTFHLNSGTLGKEPFINAEEVAELYKGHEVSVHTKTHPFLNCIPVEAVAEEVIEDRKNLESLVGYPIRGMSYPYGVYNEDTIKTLEALGIQYSRTVNAHHDFRIPDNFLTWPATCHHSDNLIETGKRFLNYQYNGKLKLMYVWGHSFEFDRADNWDLIEDFCSMMSDKDEIWYATNIEVVRYVKALKALEFSAKGDIVYNPTAMSVWINVNGSAVEIKSGQIVKL
ncbi:MAG: polysaccharide deacetylase family protein [Bacillota bacterium]|nr:polysaccharide deacetylase family protein [Bacillota bacterium]